jgi:hypothetical protein
MDLTSITSYHYCQLMRNYIFRRSLMNISMMALLVLFFSLIPACSTSDSASYVRKRAAMQAAVDDVRSHLSMTLGKAIPSISVYVQTPEGTWFVSSADSEKKAAYGRHILQVCQQYKDLYCHCSTEDVSGRMA